MARMILYLGSRTVQAAVGVCRGGRVRVRRLCGAELPEGCLINGLIADEARLGEALAAFLRRERLPRRQAALVLGGGQFVSRLLRLPHLPPAQLRAVVSHELSAGSAAADPLDDYMLLDRDAARRTDTVLATRVEKSVLDPYIALANTLGLRLCTIDLAQAGLIRLVQALPEHSRRTFILLVFEGETFSASLFENGQYKYATRGRLFHPRGTAESAAEILQKVSGMAQFQKTGANAPALTDLYFGGAAAGDLAVCAAGAAALQLRCALFPPSPHVRLPAGWALADCLYTAGSLMP